jgi:hypothetical protein
MVIGIFVDIEASKCIECVCEGKGPWYVLMAKYRKKVCCPNNGIEVENSGGGYTIVIQCI